MKKKKEIVLNTDPDIVEYKQVSGWVGKDGFFYGKNEDAARYNNSTHKKCECGNVMRKGWTKCDTCRAVSDLEKYNKLTFREWFGETPLYSHTHDEYFFDEGALEDYCEDNEVDKDNLQLVLCVENKIQEIDEDHWNDSECFMEDWDGELPAKLKDALEELNKVIRELPVQSYSPSKTRTKI